MVWWLLALICGVCLFFAAPVLLGGVFLVGFAIVSLANAQCLWRSIRRNEHHSTVPLVGGICGALGLWLISGELERTASRIWRVWFIAMPFIFDVGTLIPIISVVILATSAVRARFRRLDA